VIIKCPCGNSSSFYIKEMVLVEYALTDNPDTYAYSIGDFLEEPQEAECGACGKEDVPITY